MPARGGPKRGGPSRRGPGRRRLSLVAPGPAAKPSVGSARAAAAAAHERVVAAIVELDLDRCQNTFGLAPCTATGTPCYNTYATCKDKPHYQRGTYTWRFCSRGMPLPPGEAPMRPYVESLDIAPAEIDPTKALAMRSQTRIVMVDEPCPDGEGDPYVQQRQLTAAGLVQTLEFDFVNARTLNPIVGTAAVTFTRAGATATRVNAQGLIEVVAADTPRFDYDPVTLACKGLLIEEPRTNRIIWSESGDGFQAFGTTPPAVVNAAVNLGVTCVSVTFTAASGVGYGGSRIERTGTYAAAGITNGQTDTHGQYVSLSRALVGSESIDIYWTGSQGSTVVTINAANSAGHVGAWQRLSTQTTWAVTGAVYPVVYLSGAVASNLTVYATRFQIENGLPATSYIPTTAAAVTRNADVLSAPIAGFYNPSEGTVSVEFRRDVDSFPARLWQFNLNDAGSWVDLVLNAAGQYLSLPNGGTLAGSTNTRVVHRAVMTLKTNDFSFSVDGAAPAAFGAGVLAADQNKLELGNTAGSAQFLNGHLRRFVYFPKRLPNAMLQTLSSPNVPVQQALLEAQPMPTVQGTFWRRLLARNKAYAGRFARVRRGFVQKPWSWDTFQTELYIIESITGPDQSGRFVIQLSDVLRLADRAQLPLPTDGTLAAQLDGVTNSGFAQAGGASTITLPAAASQVDGTYVGEEVYIIAGTGAGQRRVVSAYVGNTRVATVGTPWTAVPDVTSSYEITPLQLTLAAGKGAQYPDPSTTGLAAYVKIGDEVLRYSKRAGDVLSWADGSYRAQFGTTRADGKLNASAQLCEAWVAASASQVVTRLLNAGGVANWFIDAAGLASEDTTWLGTAAQITTCITKPTKVADLLKDLLQDLNMLVWWDPVAQLVRFRVGNGGFAASIPALADDNLIAQQTQTDVVDAERLTRAAIYFDLRSATANLAEARSYGRAAVYVDTDAESQNSYGDVRQDIRFSRWLTSANANYAQAVIARKIGRFRDSPIKFALALDPRDDVLIGDLRDITSRALVDQAGAPKTARVRVTKRIDRMTHLEIEARTLAYGARYGYIAPAGYPIYDLATPAQQQYAFICGTSGAFADGTNAYIIV